MRLLAERFPREAHTQIGAYTPRRALGRPSSPPPNTAAGAASETLQRSPEPRRWLWPVASGAAIAIGIATFAIVTQKPRATPTQVADTTNLSGARLDASLHVGPMQGASPPDASIEPTSRDAAPAPRDAAPAPRDATTSPAASSGGKKPRQNPRPEPPPKPTSREKGELDVTVMRTYAEVYLGSKYLGTTPVRVKLPEGPHKITLVNPDLKLKSTVNVIIKANEPVTIEKPW